MKFQDELNSEKMQEEKIRKIESKYLKILNDLISRSKSKNYTTIRQTLSELMRVTISVQEANFEAVTIIKSDLGRYLKAILNTYERVESHIPPNVKEPDLSLQFSELKNMIRNLESNLKTQILNKVSPK